MEGADDLPLDDEGDAAGPAALLRAAAELIVDEADGVVCAVTRNSTETYCTYSC